MGVLVPRSYLRLPAQTGWNSADRPRCGSRHPPIPLRRRRRYTNSPRRMEFINHRPAHGAHSVRRTPGIWLDAGHADLQHRSRRRLHRGLLLTRRRDNLLRPVGAGTGWPTLHAKPPRNPDGQSGGQTSASWWKTRR